MFYASNGLKHEAVEPLFGPDVNTLLRVSSGNSKKALKPMMQEGTFTLYFLEETKSKSF